MAAPWAKSLQGSEPGWRSLSRREEVLKETAAELTANGFDVFYKSCDVRDPAQISALMDAVEERFGGLDVLVNNAA